MPRRLNDSVVPTQQVPRSYDVFNGDADGICALHQLRLATPREAVLLTGVKRDIALVQGVPSDAASDVTVLDVSLDINVGALQRILDAGCQVMYFDHHSAKKAFAHPHLNLIHDDSTKVCTSILVDRHLQGRYRQWAITAAFGDNLLAVGSTMAEEAELSAEHTWALQELGFLLNYNAYGERVEDLHIAPDMLYRALHAYAMPMEFIADAPQYRLLADGYQADANHIESLKPAWESTVGAVFILPCTDWARRVSGVFANRLIAQADGRSFAVLTENNDGSLLVSVRSGAPDMHSASVFCEQFPSGGGRRAAAGINCLPANELDRFIKCFSEYFVVAGAMHHA